MQIKKFRVPHRKTQRRWRVPPALKRGEETFEGLGLLEEVTGETGLVLWQSLRDVLLWAEAQDDERAALFTPDAETARMAMILAAGLDAEVEEPLGALARLLSRPEATPEELVSLACRRVAQWGDGQGMLATALAFAQAAATVTPGDAAAAFAVGKLARRRAEYARAETWFRRAVALARQSGDWATYALSFIGLGSLSRQRGNLPASRRFLVRAVRAAKRNSLHAVEACALHDLFGVAVEAERVEEAQELARAAFEAYGPGSDLLPRLAHDVAYWWITQGNFSRAVPVLHSVLPHLDEQPIRLMTMANLARAAGATGDREGFRTAWDRAFDLLRDGSVDETAAQALLELAHGAASLSLWDRAESAAREALEIGSRRNEAKIRLTAESLLDSVRHHRAVESRRATGAGREVAHAADALAEDMVRTLSKAQAVA
ncbi:MAG TPA: hypothetical protein VFQ45_15030 [Longimicrobium sp.]|nr:hypothetical protein [Longimicrobium sp.]